MQTTASCEEAGDRFHPIKQQRTKNMCISYLRSVKPTAFRPLVDLCRRCNGNSNYLGYPQLFQPICLHSNRLAFMACTPVGAPLRLLSCTAPQAAYKRSCKSHLSAEAWSMCLCADLSHIRNSKNNRQLRLHNSDIFHLDHVDKNEEQEALRRAGLLAPSAFSKGALRFSLNSCLTSAI